MHFPHPITTTLLSEDDASLAKSQTQLQSLGAKLSFPSHTTTSVSARPAPITPLGSYLPILSVLAVPLFYLVANTSTPQLRYAEAAFLLLVSVVSFQRLALVISGWVRA